jgi:hypothetical protein
LISVVIPTLGRASLKGAIESALRQGAPVCEILVINDSGAPLDGSYEPPVRIIDTAGGLGAAGARQMGVTASRGEFIAFLDDDDEWLDGHLDDALSILAGPGQVAVYTASAERVVRGARSVYPRVVYRGSTTLLSFRYGWRAFLGRNRSLPTPTWVARRERVETTMMDCSLAYHEDSAWLLDLEAKGCKIYQSKHCGVRVFPDQTRELERVTTDTELDWARRLNSLQEGAGARYVALVAGRRLARSGDPDGLHDLVRGYRASSPMSPATSVVAFGFAVLARVIRRAGRLKGVRGL